MKARSVIERFMEKVEKTETCWLWTGSKGENGYGIFFVKWEPGYGSHAKVAHRVSWELNNGPIPEGMKVCHHCDNPPCIRPDHLFLGTTKDNNRDAISKGRAFRKITPDIVRQVRSGTISPGELSERFGVHPRYAYLVRARKCWKEVQ